MDIHYNCPSLPSCFLGSIASHSPSFGPLRIEYYGVKIQHLRRHHPLLFFKSLVIFAIWGDHNVMSQPTTVLAASHHCLDHGIHHATDTDSVHPIQHQSPPPWLDDLLLLSLLLLHSPCHHYPHTLWNRSTSGRHDNVLRWERQKPRIHSRTMSTIPGLWLRWT